MLFILYIHQVSMQHRFRIPNSISVATCRSLRFYFQGVISGCLLLVLAGM